MTWGKSRPGGGTPWRVAAPTDTHPPSCLQLLSESQGHMAQLATSVGDVLDALQRDGGLGRPRVKADLQRAPSKGARPRGCANGESQAGHFLPSILGPPAWQRGAGRAGSPPQLCLCSQDTARTHATGWAFSVSAWRGQCTHCPDEEARGDAAVGDMVSRGRRF